MKIPYMYRPIPGPPKMYPLQSIFYFNAATDCFKLSVWSNCPSSKLIFKLTNAHQSKHINNSKNSNFCYFASTLITFTVNVYCLHDIGRILIWKHSYILVSKHRNWNLEYRWHTNKHFRWCGFSLLSLWIQNESSISETILNCCFIEIPWCS